MMTPPEESIAESFIDFDGDGLYDTFGSHKLQQRLLVQCRRSGGDPYLDPFANLDKSSFGSIFWYDNDPRRFLLRKTMVFGY